MNESSDTASTAPSSQGKDKVSQNNSDGGGNDQTSDIAKMRAQWDRLLDERQEMDSNDDVSDWLDRVVATSERYKAASRQAKAKST
jgi:hypothetical protein